MSEFDGIEGFDGWNAKLSELLQEAEAAAQHDDLSPRLAVSNRLTQFIAHSRPNTQDILTLDDIANQACSALLRDTIDSRLESLSKRRADLVRLTKKMQAATEAARESAATIRLERARKVASSLTDTVQELKSFQTVLQEGTDDELAKAVERLIGTMQKVRTEVERNS